jgi:hypothetical protein
MEYVLDVKQPTSVGSGEMLSEDTLKVDAQHEAEGDDPARTRYLRLFWEPVVEGQVRIHVLPRHHRQS